MLRPSLLPSLLCVLFFGSTNFAQAQAPQPSPSLEIESEPVQLRVGVAGAPPFVIYGSETDRKKSIKGISLDVWRDISDSQGWESEYFPQTSVSEAIAKVSSGELDILVGSISITPERMKNPEIFFTQPYFGSSVGVMVKPEVISLWSRVAPFFGITALSSAGILTLLLFIVGNLIWLAEHRRNSEEFHPRYAEGIQNGMWFALVTLTTVGYGDRSPKTKFGQLITSIWMIVALLSFSSITAGLASAFTAALSETVDQPSLQKPSDLNGMGVAVVADTSAVQWAEFYQAEVTSAKNLQGAVDLLTSGQVEAVMFDRPVLVYHQNQNPKLNLLVTPIRISLEPYGFILPADNPLETNINFQLVDLVYGKQMAIFTERWLGTDHANAR